MARRKKTAEELRLEAQRLLKKARALKRKEHEKRCLAIGKWVLKNEQEIQSIMPENLQTELAKLL